MKAARAWLDMGVEEEEERAATWTGALREGLHIVEM